MEIMGTWKRPLLVSMVVVGFALSAGTARAQISVGSPETEIAMGQSAGVTFSISGTSGNVATYNAELTFDVENISIDTAACVKDERLTDQIIQVTSPVPGSIILFVGDTSPPVGTFGDGPMLTCPFSAGASAPEGNYPLSEVFLEVGDAVGNVLEATATYGDLVVVEPPPVTPTFTSTATSPPTNTPTLTQTPVPPTNTATRTVTNTPGAGGDDGCNMNPNASGFPAWLLLPVAVLPFLRARNRV